MPIGIAALLNWDWHHQVYCRNQTRIQSLALCQDLVAVCLSTLLAPAAYSFVLTCYCLHTPCTYCAVACVHYLHGKANLCCSLTPLPDAQLAGESRIAWNEVTFFPSPTVAHKMHVCSTMVGMSTSATHSFDYASSSVRIGAMSSVCKYSHPILVCIAESAS